MKVGRLKELLKDIDNNKDVIFDINSESGRSFDYIVGEVYDVMEVGSNIVFEKNDMTSYEGMIYENVIVIKGNGNVYGCE